ncbi:DUF2270 domain-containing protein [Vulgatibacter sp.]|uniref:DUF2270 domain-containing protein n=1 Tax=Vulgatibacter sp. TaxID=1971226 RepID=UPI00356162BA
MAERLGRSQGKSPGISEVTLAHIYRAEVQRSTNWRTRLDTTTNWAITTTAAVVSFTFSSATSPHPTLLAGAMLVFTFLVVEARRYRYYDIWARRVRLMESGYLVPLMRREPITVDFYSAMASEFTRPRLRISALDSLVFRMRRTYAPILALLLASWVVKIDIHPVPATSWGELIARAKIGPMPGVVLWAGWVVSVGVFFWLLWLGTRAPLPATELRPPSRRGMVSLSEPFRRVGPAGQVQLRSQPPRIRPARNEDRLA